MKLLISAWELARDLVVRPSRAFERMERPGAALPEAFLVYLAFTVVFSVFYALKPADFPLAAKAAFEEGGMPQGFWFWFGTGVLGTLMTVVWTALLGAMLQFAPERRLPLSLALQLGWTAATVILVVLYYNTQLTKAGLGFAWLVLLSPLVWLARTRRIPWLRLLSLMLALNVFSALSVAPMSAAVLLRSENLYTGSELVLLLWMLGAGTAGIRRFTGLGTPRVFLPLGFTMVASVMLLFSLHFMGLVSTRMLKVYFLP